MTDEKKTSKGRIALVALLLVVVARLAFAGTAVTENFGEIRKPTTKAAPTFVAALSDLDGTDSTTWNPTTATTGRTVVLEGDGTLEVQVRFDAATPGQTACLQIARRARDGTFQGPTAGTATIQTSTIFAGNELMTDGTGWYGETLVFHLAGWYAAEIHVVDVSGSGTVDLKPATIGLAARAAE